MTAKANLWLSLAPCLIALVQARAAPAVSDSPAEPWVQAIEGRGMTGRIGRGSSSSGESSASRRLLRTVVLSDFESRNVDGWSAVPASKKHSAESGISSNIGSNRVPSGVGGRYSLAASFESGDGSAGVWGFVWSGLNRNVPIEGMDTFSFWINPKTTVIDPPSNTSADFTLEVFMQDADLDEFRSDCAISSSGPCAIIDGGWQEVTIPLEDFKLTYSVIGSDGILMGPVNAMLLRVNANVNSATEFHIDNMYFTESTLERTTTTQTPVTVENVSVRSTIVDGGSIDCPKPVGKCAASDMNCCLANRGGGGKRPTYRLDQGEKLEAGQWLCRDQHMFGLHHSGSVHVLKAQDEKKEQCDVVWTATVKDEGRVVLGDYIEVNDEGIFCFDGIEGKSRSPVWQARCGMGEGSRIQMPKVKEQLQSARAVMLTVIEERDGRKRPVKDWWVSSGGNEDARDC